MFVWAQHGGAGCWGFGGAVNMRCLDAKPVLGDIVSSKLFLFVCPLIGSPGGSKAVLNQV